MLETVIDTYGEGAILTASGAIVGLLFGATAQHSRFCLRAATVEVAEGRLGPRLSIWLIAFSSAVLLVQSLIALGYLDVSQARQLAATGSMSGAIIGAAVALGWFLTYILSQNSFEVVPVASVTFTGPSTDTLMGLVNETSLPLGFGVGLVPGVFAGAAIAALVSREAQIERFGPDTPMERYLVGAALMGFGSMLAGGCAVGAGMSGGAIFALTAWVAVTFMWIGAMATHVLLGRTGRAAIPAE